MKYYSSLFIFVLLTILTFNSYGENGTPSNQCVKLHDEVSDCFNNVDISQKEASTALAVCGQQFSDLMQTMASTLQDQPTLEERQKISSLSFTLPF